MQHINELLPLPKFAEDGVDHGVKIILITFFGLIILGDFLSASSTALITLGAFLFGWFWVGHWCLDMAWENHRSPTWAFFIGATFNLIGLMAYWVFVKIFKEGDVEYHPKDSKFWYNKGVNFSDSKEYEKALMAYDQALIYNDKDSDIWNNKCYVLTKLGKYDEAIKSGKIAVELAPNDSDLWETLRDAFIGYNDRENADECQKNVIRLKK